MKHGNRQTAILNALTSYGALRALRYKNFTIYAPFSFIASIGFWIQRIGVQWLVWTLTGSYAWLGAIVFAEAIAIIAVTPLAGALVDQMNRATLARITRALLSAIAFAIGACVYFELISIPLLIVLIVIAGVADGLWTPTRLAIVPNLVPREAIPAAIAFEATSFHSTQFIGPAIAGLVIAGFGLDAAFLINGFLFTSVIIALFFIEVRNPLQDETRASFIERIADAIRYLREQRGMFALLLFATLTAFFLRPYREFYAGFADEIFNRGANGLAMLATSSGLGALIATLVVGGHGKTSGLSKGLLFSAVASIGAMIIFATAPTFLLANIGSFALGFALTSLGISAQILLQNSVEDAKRGRVMSLWGLQLRAIPSIGGFLIGAVASVIEIRIALLGSAALFTAAVFIFIWPQRAAIRKLESAESENT